jgi:hypothetical protein
MHAVKQSHHSCGPVCGVVYISHHAHSVCSSRALGANQKVALTICECKLSVMSSLPPLESHCEVTMGNDVDVI